MKVVALVHAATQMKPWRYDDTALLLEQFAGQTVLGRVFQRLQQTRGISEIVFLAPPGTELAPLAAVCADAGVRVYECGEHPYHLNLPYKVADECGADYGMLISGYGLFFDPVLAAAMLDHHLAQKCALTFCPPLPAGLLPQIFSVATVRAVKQQYGRDYTEPQWLFNPYWRENPEQIVYYRPNLPVPVPAGIATLCYHNAATRKTFADAVAALGDAGTGKLLGYVAAHQHEFRTGPAHVYVELTSRCNQACVFCPHEKRDTKVDMEQAAFQKILDSKPLGIDIAGYGEPMLHPQFWEMIDTAVTSGTEVYLYTNGTQWDSATAARLLDSGIRAVIFGIDAVTPEMYRKVRGADGLEAVNEHVLELLRLKKERGLREPIVAVQIVKSKINDAEIEEFWTKWNERDRFERMKLDDYDYAAESGKQRMEKMEIERKEKDEAVRKQKLQALSAEGYERYMNAFYKHCELPLEHVVIQRCNDYAGQLEDMRVVDFTPLKRFSCRQVSYGLMVLADGTVVPCQQDFNGTMALGNVNETDLIELWNSPKMKALQADQREGRFETNPLCAKCRDWFIPMV